MDLLTLLKLSVIQKNTRQFMDKAEKILKSGGLNLTANRLRVMKVLTDSEGPLSINDLYNKLETIDKSNIFRALNLFRKSGLVHAIDDGCDSTKYELTAFTEDNGRERHANFHCKICHKTYCLTTTPIHTPEIPDDFTIQEINYVIKGICPDCNKK